MFGGIWGTLATGLFDNTTGLLYGFANGPKYFGYQVLGIVCVMAWVGGMSSIIFYTLKRLKLFRVDSAIELIGLDIAEMGGLSEEVYEKVRQNFTSNQLSPKSAVRKALEGNGANINLSNSASALLGSQ